MNGLNIFLANKCLETASVELAKQAIMEDMTISLSTKQNWISMIDTWSNAKNMADIFKIMFGK